MPKTSFRKNSGALRYRLMDVWERQKMQMKQQIDFLSNGAKNLRGLQTMM
jgi:hypothetical protein